MRFCVVLTDLQFRKFSKEVITVEESEGEGEEAGPATPTRKISSVSAVTPIRAPRSGVVKSEPGISPGRRVSGVCDLFFVGCFMDSSSNFEVTVCSPLVSLGRNVPMFSSSIA